MGYKYVKGLAITILLNTFQIYQKETTLENEMVEPTYAVYQEVGFGKELLRSTPDLM